MTRRGISHSVNNEQTKWYHSMQTLSTSTSQTLCFSLSKTLLSWSQRLTESWKTMASLPCLCGVERKILLSLLSCQRPSKKQESFERKIVNSVTKIHQFSRTSWRGTGSTWFINGTCQSDTFWKVAKTSLNIRQEQCLTLQSARLINFRKSKKSSSKLTTNSMVKARTFLSLRSRWSSPRRDQQLTDRDLEPSQAAFIYSKLFAI